MTSSTKTSSTTTPLDRTPIRLALCLGLALATLLALGAGRAAAEITSSQITAPATTVFGIYLTDQPGTLRVAGTTDSTDPTNDKVDVDCVGNGGSYPVATGVGLAANGTFSTEIPSYYLYGICRLRAVPAGQSYPSEAAQFAGPFAAFGYASNYEVEHGPDTGRSYNFNVRGQQMSAADQFDSVGSCGYSGGYLYNAEFEETANTFSCSDYFWTVADEEDEADSRSEVQVDGVNAYFPAAAKYINQEAPGLPTVSWAFHQNPTDGDLTVEESEPLVACDSTAFPPREACPDFVSTGVYDMRTIEQTEDGHLVTITDRYFSSDGAPHSLDMLNQQGLHFAQTFSAQSPLGVRFPGQTTFATYSTGDVVNLPSGAPGVIYARKEGKADGDETTGRGAIVFDRPASSATFNHVSGSETEFYLHQTATVPASGATTFRFAYAQSYDQATVERLAGQAEAAFAAPAPQPVGPVTTGGSGTPAGQGSTPAPKPGPTSGGAPSGRIVFGRLALDRSAGTAKLTVMAPAAGHLVLNGAGVLPARRRVSAAGPVVLPVRPTATLAEALRRRGHVRVLLKVAFTPVGGSPAVRTRPLVLARTGG